MTLEPPRLILRRWEERDRGPFAAMNADPRVMGEFPGVMTRSESNELMDHFTALWNEDGFCYGAIERKSDGAFLGMAGIAWCRFDAPICPCFEIGWSLARAHWGQGYATEAARGWLAHGFGSLDLPEIVAFTDAANARSLAMMGRLGLVSDAPRDFEDPSLQEGRPVRRQMLHTLTREAWLTQTAGELR